MAEQDREAAAQWKAKAQTCIAKFFMLWDADPDSSWDSMDHYRHDRALDVCFAELRDMQRMFGPTGFGESPASPETTKETTA